MGIPLMIRHTGKEGDAPASLSVVTVGRLDGEETKLTLRPGEQREVTLARGQFALIDETDEKEGT